MTIEILDIYLVRIITLFYKAIQEVNTVKVLIYVNKQLYQKSSLFYSYHAILCSGTNKWQ